MKYSINTY